MPKKKRKIKVVKKKLWRSRAWGQAFIGEDLIELDSRLRGKRKMTILIHEILHHLDENMSESKVEENSKILADVLWDEGYREVDNLFF